MLYLPAGTKWIDFWTGKTFEGGRHIEKQSPVDIMPLHVRAGSIITMGPMVQFANEKYDPLEIRIYPGADGEFVLYDDEKDNYNYEKGLYSTIDLTWDDEEQTLTIGERKGSFPGMAKQRQFNIVLVGPGRGCGLNPSEEISHTVIYRGKRVISKLNQ